MRRNYLCAILLCLASVTLPAQTVTQQIPVGNNPQAVAVNPTTNKIYVANYASNNITVIDGATGNPVFVGAGAGPVAVAVDTATNKVYVANSLGTDVTVIDGATNAITPVVVGFNPESLAVNPVTNKIYVASLSTNAVTVIDGATNNTSTIPVGTTPKAVAVDTVTNKIYVANWTDNTVTVIDGATLATTTIAAGTNPLAIAVNPVTNQIYVANNGSNNVTVINGATHGTSTIAAGTNPYAVAINEVTNTVYIANYESANLTVINGSTSATSTVATGVNPASITVNQMTNQLYIGCQSSSDLIVLNGANNTVTGLLAVGGDATAVALNPVTNKVYAATLGTNTFSTNNVSVVDGATYPINASLAAPGNISAINPVSNQIYFVSGSSVVVMDGANDAVVQSIDTGFNGGITGLVVNAVSNKLYVSGGMYDNEGNYSLTLIVIDGNTSAITTIPLGAYAMAFNPAANKLYFLPGAVTDTLVIVDGATDAASAVSLPGLNGYNIAVNPASNKIYVGSEASSPSSEGLVTIVDGSTYTTSTVSVGAGPMVFAFNPAMKKTYVVGATYQTHGLMLNTGTSITEIDDATNTSVIIPLTVGLEAGNFSLLVNPNNNKLYLENLGDGTVTVFSAAVAPIVKYQVANGETSFGITIDPVGNKLYVPIAGTGLELIDGATDALTSIKGFTSATAVVINPVTENIYVADSISETIDVMTEQQTVANPLVATVVPLSANVTFQQTPTFNFTATSTYAPIAPPVQDVFYQLDTEQGQWLPATGAAPNFTGALSNVQLGSHVIYYYATDGSDSTAAAIGATSIGQISAYPFTVVNP